MHINACQVIAEVDADGVDGFRLMAYRWVDHNDKVELPPADAERIEKGPFYSNEEAVRYAMSWNDATKPPIIPPHCDLTINGCQVTAVECKSAPDGYQSRVSRKIIVVGELLADSATGTPVPTTTKTLTQGPFDSAKSAIEYAKSWTILDHPPAMPIAASSKMSAAESLVAASHDLKAQSENLKIVAAATSTKTGE